MGADDLPTVQLRNVGVEASRLGFGCASLGSRIDAKAGRRALDAAFELGCTWFDVAPSYGDGRAERILGEFLASAGEAARVCTKVGLQAGATGGLMNLLRPAARGLLRLAPGARRLARARTAAVRPPLTPESIARSVEASLTALGRERVDVLAWHDPLAEEAGRDEILRAFEDVLVAGKARALGVAGSAADIQAIVRRASFFGVAQTPLNPAATDGLEIARRNLGLDLITHSVIGRHGLLERLGERLAEPGGLRAAEARGYAGAPRQIAAAMLLDYALIGNPRGVVLVSMFDPRHLREDLARARQARDPSLAKWLGALLSPGAGAGS